MLVCAPSDAYSFRLSRFDSLKEALANFCAAKWTLEILTCH